MTSLWWTPTRFYRFDTFHPVIMPRFGSSTTLENPRFVQENALHWIVRSHTPESLKSRTNQSTCQSKLKRTLTNYTAVQIVRTKRDRAWSVNKFSFSCWQYNTSFQNLWRIRLVLSCLADSPIHSRARRDVWRSVLCLLWLFFTLPAYTTNYKTFINDSKGVVSHGF